MKIVSYSNSRSVALFPVEEFVPLGGTSERLLLERIADRYQFMRVPDLRVSREEMERTGLRFDHGEMQTESDITVINQLVIYRDGVVVAARTTDEAEAAFDDMHSWLVSDFGFRPVAPTKLYLSEIVVDFERPLSKLFRGYSKLMELVNRHMDADSRSATASALESIAIKFWNADGSDPPKFVIDKRTGTSAAAERYYCSAPLRTAHHVEVLEGIEALLG